MNKHESSARHAPVVLLVDDEPGLVQLFAGLLARLSCTVLTGLSGDEAINILDHETPDLLILDLALPGVPGVDVLRYVRTTPRLEKMTVMILTARPNLIPEVRALGIDYWVSKPVLPHDFLEIVRDVLDDARSHG